MESVLVIVGLSNDSGRNQDVYRISLDRPDSVKTIGTTPVHVAEESAGCVIENNMFAVGIGYNFGQVYKWNERSNWTQCALMN